MLVVSELYDLRYYTEHDQMGELQALKDFFRCRCMCLNRRFWAARICGDAAIAVTDLQNGQ